jgi:hypothetical protein
VIRPHVVPEAVIRDDRRGLWILVLPHAEFVGTGHEREVECEPFAYAELPLPVVPGLTLRELVAQDDLSEVRIDRTMIAILLGWVGVFCWMFYCLAHL